MTRVLVISGSQSVGEGGLAEGQDVIDDRPPAFEEWLAGGPFDIDALILDLATPIAARLAVDDVRRRSIDVPIVLVAKELPEWNDPQLRSLPDCVVVESPLDPETLRAAVNSFHQAPDGLAPGADNGVATAFPGDGVQLLRERVTEYRIRRTSKRHRTETADTALDAFSAPRAPNAGAPSPTTTSPVPEGSGVPRAGPVPRHRRPPNSRAGVPEATGPLPVSAIALVRSLLSRVAELDGVATTTDVIVKSAAERTGADAGVVLLPDGGHWRVAGGIGLRPVEYRFQLGEDSWLVREIAFGSRGLIVEDTDIARSRLRGAPLASWRHLMAAPVSRVGAVLLMARRDDPPFDEAALSALAEVTDEAGPLIAVAMDVRALARALEDFRDRP